MCFKILLLFSCVISAALQISDTAADTTTENPEDIPDCEGEAWSPIDAPGVHFGGGRGENCQRCIEGEYENHLDWWDKYFGFGDADKTCTSDKRAMCESTWGYLTRSCIYECNRSSGPWKRYLERCSRAGGNELYGYDPYGRRKGKTEAPVEQEVYNGGANGLAGTSGLMISITVVACIYFFLRY